MIVNWNELRTFEIADAEIAAPWILVVETLADATYLQIKAEGSWTAMGGLLVACGPDGLAGLSLVPERLIAIECPVGALIGKIGGSSAAIGSSMAEGEGKARDWVSLRDEHTGQVHRAAVCRLQYLDETRAGGAAEGCCRRDNPDNLTIRLPTQSLYLRRLGSSPSDCRSLVEHWHRFHRSG